MINNYKDFKKYLESLDNKPKLLVHACCGPCSTHTLALLNQYFDITVFFDNSNIDTKEEFDKRYFELEKVVNQFEDIKLVVNNYNPKTYYEMVKGHEHDGEFSMRCYLCMKLRLENSFNYATNNNFDLFTTTLSISPYKSSKWINEIGFELAKDSKNTKFLYSDFKKEEGYKNSIKMSNDLNLYRQHYCGCIFSKNELKEKENG
jgi:predicted adenine nucleotide alpha hydrolase (AANH) superfamily ATPase